MSPRDIEVTDQVIDTCPIRDLLDQVGGKWSVQVIEELAEGPRRFSELERSIEGVSRRMLTRTLRSLERDGLVSRTVYATVPPSVEYAVTPLATDLVVPLTALADWARAHRADVAAARHAYDSTYGGNEQLAVPAGRPF
ncbi:winged helix-turn-helix transcriptional regulator [Nocardia alni]|uniref:winged helix-turn-helix transcriptional regulator n=1 Tax=Nocardia alni TaxID=2815723 RepID=UPI001C24EB6C|nr:helix-turn-helix domain-containing protein [Nocardia alni]